MIAANRPSLRRAFSVALSLGLLVGASWVLFGQVDDLKANEDSDSDRSAVLKVAKDQALALTTLDKDSIKTQLQSLEDRSTGEFKDQMASLSSVFTTVIAKQNVVSKGDIAGAGVVSISPNQAQVLVAATATVTQTSAAKPRVQHYRMSVQLTKSNGSWLISGMEFVP